MVIGGCVEKKLSLSVEDGNSVSALCCCDPSFISESWRKSPIHIKGSGLLISSAIYGYCGDLPSRGSLTFPPRSRIPTLPSFETFPLKSINELLHMPPLPLVPQRPPLEKRMSARSKVLVCHDLAGNYHGDRFVHGSQLDEYNFTHWNEIDVFVYFSHKRVTVPRVLRH